MPAYAPAIPITAADVRIVADTHFSEPGAPGEGARRARFIRFLDDLPGTSALFLLGDIFDFYFEYRSVIPRRYFDIYMGLWRARARGVTIHFLGGNHDHWVGPFFTHDLGITVHEREIFIESQGRRVLLAHGDLVMPRDYGYKLLKSVIRNRLFIGVVGTIHPDLLASVAHGVADGSRKVFSIPQEKRARAVLAHGWERFYVRGNDAFIMGHVHYPLHETRDGKEFLILGDWIEHFTYARLSGGHLRLETFRS